MRIFLVLCKEICLPGWKKRTRKAFGQLYLPVRKSLTPNPAIGRGEKNTKTQHEPQFLSELIICDREQKMEDGVLVGM